mgnify:FL=1|jgi:hypothetical protein
MKPIKPICRYALAAAALICTMWLVQSPVIKQQRAEAADIQTAFIQPLPLPTEPDNPWAKMSDSELLRGDAEVQP